MYVYSNVYVTPCVHVPHYVWVLIPTISTRVARACSRCSHTLVTLAAAIPAISTRVARACSLRSHTRLRRERRLRRHGRLCILIFYFLCHNPPAIILYIFVMLNYFIFTFRAKYIHVNSEQISKLLM